MENQMNSVIYAEKKTFFPFGDGHIVAFLYETVIEDWKQPGSPDDAPLITGYEYTGPREDGGTLLPCDNISDYGELTNAIIRSKYSLSEEMAIHRHHSNGDEGYEEEWAEYNDFCEQAKTLAKKWLGIV